MNEAPTSHYLRLIKKKPGIYMFTNNITYNRFIGKSSNLLKTFLNYNSKSFPEKNPNSKIQKAIRKHGYVNFSISILEYCNASELQNKKQYYINVLKPQYNIQNSICDFVASSPDKTPTAEMIPATKIKKKKKKNKKE
jgi:group I intron endonuclease